MAVLLLWFVVCMCAQTGTYQLVVGTLNGTVLWQTTEAVSSPLDTDASWTEVGVVNSDDSGIYWECPDLFQLPGTSTWVSKVGVMWCSVVWVGDLQRVVSDLQVFLCMWSCVVWSKNRAKGDFCFCFCFVCVSPSNVDTFEWTMTCYHAPQQSHAHPST